MLILLLTRIFAVSANTTETSYFVELQTLGMVNCICFEFLFDSNDTPAFLSLHRTSLITAKALRNLDATKVRHWLYIPQRFTHLQLQLKRAITGVLANVWTLFVALEFRQRSIQQLSFVSVPVHNDVRGHIFVQ